MVHHHRERARRRGWPTGRTDAGGAVAGVLPPGEQLRVGGIVRDVDARHGHEERDREDDGGAPRRSPVRRCGRSGPVGRRWLLCWTSCAPSSSPGGMAWSAPSLRRAGAGRQGAGTGPAIRADPECTGADCCHDDAHGADASPPGAGADLAAGACPPRRDLRRRRSPAGERRARSSAPADVPAVVALVACWLVGVVVTGRRPTSRRGGRSSGWAPRWRGVPSPTRTPSSLLASDGGRRGVPPRSRR